VDHAGPFQGKIILVVIDAHSKWIEAATVSSTSSAATIKVLRNLFATHGVPELLFSDNGSSFTSEEFRDFVQKNGIRHRTSSPYHPATNGLAERAVQVVKSGLRKTPEGDMDLRLARLLFKYRNTLHATTGMSPAELLLEGTSYSP
jgi:transposase InsO family protein